VVAARRVKALAAAKAATSPVVRKVVLTMAPKVPARKTTNVLKASLNTKIETDSPNLKKAHRCHCTDALFFDNFIKTDNVAKGASRLLAV
jgi:hypothetical protein